MFSPLVFSMLAFACACAPAPARAYMRACAERRFNITVEAHLQVLEDLGVTQVHLDELTLAKGGITRDRLSESEGTRGGQDLSDGGLFVGGRDCQSGGMFDERAGLSNRWTGLSDVELFIGERDCQTGG